LEDFAIRNLQFKGFVRMFPGGRQKAVLRKTEGAEGHNFFLDKNPKSNYSNYMKTIPLNRGQR